MAQDDSNQAGRSQGGSPAWVLGWFCIGVGIAEMAAPRHEHVKKTITVNRSPGEVYRFWRDFENLPRFMEHLESVQVIDGRRSHWKAKSLDGGSLEWDVEIIDDRPNTLITWRALQHADVDNTGTVRFTPAPRGQGTVIRVELRYDPPGRKIGAAVAKFFGEKTGRQVVGDLRRLKQVLETGEQLTLVPRR